MNKLACLGGWVEWEGHCYQIQVHYLRSWQSAEDSCVSQGAHLASIHSQEERWFIQTLPSYDYGHLYWIGASDLAKEVKSIISSGKKV